MGRTIKLINKQPRIIIKQVGVRGQKGDGDKHFAQAFSSANQVVVNHNLNKYPSVSIVGADGEEVEGEVTHLSNLQLRVNFALNFSGKVYCN